MDIISTADELRRKKKAAPDTLGAPDETSAVPLESTDQTSRADRPDPPLSGSGADIMRLGLIGTHTTDAPATARGEWSASQDPGRSEAASQAEGPDSMQERTKDIRPVLNLNLDRLVIGRDPDSDICLNDGSVGLHHALLTRKGSEFWLQDLDSPTGTLVNDEPITKRLLRDGDKLRIGDYGFWFVDRKRTDRAGWERALIAGPADGLSEESLLGDLLEVLPPEATESPTLGAGSAPSPAEAGARSLALGTDAPAGLAVNAPPPPIKDTSLPEQAGGQLPPTDDAAVLDAGDMESFPVDPTAEPLPEEALAGGAANCDDGPVGQRRRTTTGWMLGAAAAAAVVAVAGGAIWWPHHLTDASSQPRQAKIESSPDLAPRSPRNTEAEAKKPALAAHKPTTPPTAGTTRSAHPATITGGEQMTTTANSSAARVPTPSATEAASDHVGVPARSAVAPHEPAVPPLAQRVDKAAHAQRQSVNPAQSVETATPKIKPRPRIEELSTQSAAANQPKPGLAPQLTASGGSERDEHPTVRAPSQSPDKDQQTKASATPQDQVASRALVTSLLRLQQGDLTGALKVAGEGLAVAPKDAGLLAIRDEAQRRRQEWERRQAQLKAETEKLLVIAREQRAKTRLTSPAGDNAYETLRRVLALDPKNEAARAGLHDIADDYLRLARRAGARGKWSESVELADRGLSVAPANQGLLALRAEAIKRSAAAQRATATLHRRGNSRRRPSPPPARRAKPAEESRAQHASKDLARFIAGLNAKALQMKKEGRVEECRRLVETGLHIAPGDLVLLQLQKELKK